MIDWQHKRGREYVVRAYQLYVKVEGAWEWLCTIDAETHADAFGRALVCLRHEDEQRPIRIEQDTDWDYRKPCPLSDSAPST